jgi:hypothetical protein
MSTARQFRTKKGLIFGNSVPSLWAVSGSKKGPTLLLKSLLYSSS